MTLEMTPAMQKIFSYKAFIFDLDGTLINSMPFHVKAWIQVGAEHGFVVDPALIYSMGGVSSRDVVTYFASQGHDVGDIDEFVKRKVQLYRENMDKVETIKPIEEVLIKGHELGIKIAVGTGTQRINAVDILQKLGLERYVDAIVSADDVKRHKPFPDTFLKCCSLMGVEPKDTLVFEDGKLGVQAAIDGGMHCVEVVDCKCDFAIKTSL